MVRLTAPQLAMLLEMWSGCVIIPYASADAHFVRLNRLVKLGLVACRKLPLVLSARLTPAGRQRVREALGGKR